MTASGAGPDGSAHDGRRMPGDHDPEPSRAARGGDWPPWGIGIALAGFVAGIVGAVLAGSLAYAITGDAESLPTLVASLLGLWGGYLGSAHLVSRRAGTGRFDVDLRLSLRWRDAAVGVAAGLLSSIVLVRLVYLVLVLLGIVGQDDLERLSDPAQRVGDLASGPGWIVLVVFVGIGAPVVEEIFYRGLLQPAVVRRLGPGLGILVTAAVFGIAHQQALQLPALAAFGGVLGWLAWRHGRLGPNIVAHVTFNLLTLAQLALTT